jgi:hypothetical protein
MEKVIELEEKRLGKVDPRLAPLYMAYGNYVDDLGNHYEAQVIRSKAAELYDLSFTSKNSRSCRQQPSASHQTPSPKGLRRV